MDTQELTASEALFGFVGWLTSRESAVTLSSKHDASIAVDLVGRFIEKNGLQEPREQWQKLLTHPD